MTLRYGSLFSGVGGLEMGVQAVLGGQTVWHCETDPAASLVLARHWPDVPNLGDVTAVDWTGVEPVDVITGGFPCQDVSLAGRRAGMIRDGEGRTRSGLWGQMLRAIDTLRPSLVVAENVRGILSARADSDVEPCPWCLGDAGDTEPAVRALGAVLADLAGIGYDAWWNGPTRCRRGRPPTDGSESSSSPGLPTPRTTRGGSSTKTTSLLPTPRTSDTNGAGTHGDGGPDLRTAVTLLPTPRATDGTKGGPNQRGSSGDMMLPSAVHHLLPTPTATPYGWQKSPSPGAAVRRSLDGTVRLLPTPTAMDSGGSDGSNPANVTLTDAVIRTDMGRAPNQRHGASTPTPSTDGPPSSTAPPRHQPNPRPEADGD